MAGSWAKMVMRKLKFTKIESSVQFELGPCRAQQSGAISSHKLLTKD